MTDSHSDPVTSSLSSATSAQGGESEILWTPANIVTIIRICGIPLFLVVFLWPVRYDAAASSAAMFLQPLLSALIFVLLSVTDTLDGYLARSRNEVTAFGKLIDPLADKLLVCGALIALVEKAVIPSWIVLVIVAREFIISGLRSLAASKGEVIAASWYGKFKTIFQMVAIVLFMLMDCFSRLLPQNLQSIYVVLSWIMLSVALVLTIVSMVDYFYKCRYILGFAKRKGEHEAHNDLPSSGSKSSEDIALYANELALRCRSVAAEIITACTLSHRTLSCAESLTGGLISSFLTAVPGSSAVVKGGAVTYASSAKASILGVSTELLCTVGAVDEEVVRQMAKGSAEIFDADVCVAVSGIAGPTGDEPGKPVGTVCFGLYSAGQGDVNIFAETCHFAGSRDEVRLQTALHALELIREACA